MDAITLTILFKGLGMSLAICAGILTVRYGYHLYKDGTGQENDRAAFEIGEIRLGAHSVGSVVMCTAFLWGLVGVWLSPSINQGKDTIVVSSLISPDEGPDDYSLVSSPLPRADTVVTDTGELAALFHEVTSDNVEKGKYIPWLRLGGERARLDTNSLGYLRDEDGQIIIMAHAYSGSNSARVAFRPYVNSSSQIVFKPQGVSTVETNEQGKSSPNKRL